MNLSPLLAVVAAAALSSTAALSATITINDSTEGSPTFNRTTETGALSIIGSNVAYDAYNFTVSLTGSYTLTLAAADPSSYDTFLHLYQGGFSPADPETHFVAGNDDISDSNTNSQLVRTLTAGASYTLVLDGSSNLDAGLYTATISGPGNVNVVPEPSSIIALLGGSGLLLLRRRRRA